MFVNEDRSDSGGSGTWCNLCTLMRQLGQSIYCWILSPSGLGKVSGLGPRRTCFASLSMHAAAGVAADSKPQAMLPAKGSIGHHRSPGRFSEKSVQSQPLRRPARSSPDASFNTLVT